MEALDDAYGVRGWRWLLFLEGIPTILLGCCVPLFMTNKPEEARWLKLWPEEWRDKLLSSLNCDATDDKTEILPRLPILFI